MIIKYERLRQDVDRVREQWKKGIVSIDAVTHALSGYTQLLQGKAITVLFSGGADSLASFLLLKALKVDVTPVFFDIGQTYSGKESRSVGSIEFLTLVEYEIHDKPILRVSVPELQSKEFLGDLGVSDTSLIYARNQALVSLAAMRNPDGIVLSTVLTDRTYSATDCDDKFLAKMTEITSHVLSKDVLVFSPITHFTKTEVYSILSCFYKQEQLAALFNWTVSCYHPVFRRCGACVACLRRAVMTVNNGIPWTSDDPLKVHPLDNPELIETVRNKPSIPKEFLDELDSALAVHRRSK